MVKREKEVAKLLLENAKYVVDISVGDSNIFHKVLNQVFVDAYGYAAPENCKTRPEFFGHAAHRKAEIYYVCHRSSHSISAPYSKEDEVSSRVNEAVRKYFEKTDKPIIISVKVKSEVREENV